MIHGYSNRPPRPWPGEGTGRFRSRVERNGRRLVLEANTRETNVRGQLAPKQTSEPNAKSFFPHTMIQPEVHLRYRVGIFTPGRGPDIRPRCRQCYPAN